MFTGLFKDDLTCEVSIRLSLKQMYFKGLVLGPACLGQSIDGNFKNVFHWHCSQWEVFLIYYQEINRIFAFQPSITNDQLDASSM